MSLPPDLRVLCFQLSSTPTDDLLRLVPTLLQRVTHCQIPLSSPAGSAAGSDASTASMLVHKLKTQLSSLLKGQSFEGRFAAVALIKGVVEVGGWEVLQSSELKNFWIPGLLSILVKPDNPATKELCILTLTKIYAMTHQYQTLVREITTPTLPTFITSCLNLIASKSSSKRADAPSSLLEAIFCSFATLVPRFPTLYRPEVSRIRLAARPYLAPTLSDALVPSSLKASARRLVVLLHLTVVKNAGGEEWGKAVRDLVKLVHVTADQAFRAVVEDWESTAGYISEAVDVNHELAGGSNAIDDLPPWTSIHAGVDRIVGLLAMLNEYIMGETSLAVSIPLGAIMDMTTRMLSIAIPSSSQPSARVRLHPAVDRDERDGLWSGMSQIYIATLKLLATVADRLQEGFAPLASAALSQVTWIFTSGRSDLSFHSSSYRLTRKILLLVGKSLDKTQTAKLAPMIRSCCRDLQSGGSNSVTSGPLPGSISKEPTPNLHADTYLQSRVMSVDARKPHTEVIEAANELLPLLVSHLPQKHLDIPLRSLIERTAILAHNKDAMLACIMSQFVGKDGRAMTAIVPYASREFCDDTTVELLLRPRMPLVPSTAEKSFPTETANLVSEDEDMEIYQKQAEAQYETHEDTVLQEVAALEDNGRSKSLERQGFGNTRSSVSPPRYSGFSVNAGNPETLGTSHDAFHSLPSSRHAETTLGLASETHMRSSQQNNDDTMMLEQPSESDDESVHLTMELDTDSDDSDDIDGQG